MAGERWSQVKVVHPMKLAKLIGWLYASSMFTFQLEHGSGPGAGPFFFEQYPGMERFIGIGFPPCMTPPSWAWIRVTAPSTFFGPQAGWIFGDCTEIHAWAMFLRGHLLSPREYWVLQQQAA